MSEAAVGMDSRVIEWVKQSTLRWYGHLMRMNECDFRGYMKVGMREGETISKVDK